MNQNKLYLSDLKSVVSFKKWINENFNFSKEIPDTVILIFLDYIQNQIKLEPTYPLWMKNIRKIKNELIILQRNENEL